ncbi:MAG: hypothetical protein AAGF96_07300 [Bacteroidota bacterium]
MKKSLSLLFITILSVYSCSKDDDPTPLPENVTITILNYDIDDSSVLLRATEPNNDLTGFWSLESTTNGNFVDSTDPITTFSANLFEGHRVRWTLSNGVDSVYEEVVINISENFTLIQLLNEGVEIDVLLNEYTIQELLDANVSIEGLLQAGVPVQNLIVAEVTITELISAGITIQHLLEVGITIQQLIAANVTVEELSQAGVTVENLIDAEVTITELISAGVTIQQLLEAGITIQQLIAANVTVEELIQAGVTVQNLIDAEVTITKLISAGVTILQLLEAGITIQQLIAANVTVEELIQAGVTVQNLIDVQVSLIQIVEANVSSLTLINLGVSKEDLQAENIIAEIPGTNFYILNYFREKYDHLTATNFCNNLVVGNFVDWHLPTIDELRTIFTNRSQVLFEFTDEDYWSSTFSHNGTDQNGTNPNYFTKNMDDGFESTFYGFEKRIIPVIQQ